MLTFQEPDSISDNGIYEDEEDWYVEVEDPEDSVEQTTKLDHSAKKPLSQLPSFEGNVGATKSTDRPKLSIPTSKTFPVASKVPTVSQKPAVTRPEVGNKSFEPQHNKQVNLGGPQTGAPQDLAAVLKAKFEARSESAIDSTKSSVDDASKNSKLAISKNQGALKPLVPNAKAMTTTPSKPSDLKESQGSVPHPSSTLQDVKSFSKQPPPLKVKPGVPVVPSKPAAVSSHIQDTKPTVVSIPKKPVTVSVSRDLNKNSDLKEKHVMKSTEAESTNLQLIKPNSAEKSEPVKPNIASKPKPAILSKPVIPGKPTPVDQKGSQSINSLASSLSGKLNFGQNPSQRKSPVSSESTKSQSSLPAVPAKSSAASTAVSPTANSYIAICDFVAENEGELELHEGDEVEVLEQNGDWSLVQCWDEKGWAPSGYLQKL